MLLFYVLSPIPMSIGKRYAAAIDASSAMVEMCIFLTAGIVVSAYGLPLVLAHSGHNGSPVVCDAWSHFKMLLHVHVFTVNIM